MNEKNQVSGMATQPFEKLLFETLVEQRRKRRWGIFFRIIFALYVLFFLLLISGSNTDKTLERNKPHTAIIDIQGPIFSDDRASADHVIKSLEQAFKNKNTQGIILKINSPGGSPVQADEIYSAITRLRTKYPNIKVYAVCTDMCASAAYYVASASNDIYANRASLVGSIGVIMEGFGFVDAIQKLGVQRRVFTAGQNKDFMDPFLPMTPAEEAHAKQMLHDVHQLFIERVKEGRGNRLNTNDPNLFSGQIWTGDEAKKLGLIDGFGGVHYVAREMIKNTTIVNYTKQPGVLDTISKHMGASIGHALANALGLRAEQSVQLR